MAALQPPPPEHTAFPEHTVSIVIPVYQGERTLALLIEEIEPLTRAQRSPEGHPFRVTEVVLVNDCGPDDSARVMRQLEASHPFVRTVWLSRNFGQHPATLAGVASSGGDWIVTLDEDGQHDPADVPRLLDTAIDEQVAVVYARPTNPPPHGAVRNTASRLAKFALAQLSGTRTTHFNSFRLMLGSTGRSVAAYAGSGVYFDVAVGWLSASVATTDVLLREGSTRRSGYSIPGLFSHFWRMILSSGTRALRAVSVLGAGFALVGTIVAIVLLVGRVVSNAVPEGWTSTIVVLLFGIGAILISLGIIAEYVGVSVNMAMGKPPYLITGDPLNGPLGRISATSLREANRGGG
ncbi:mannosyltransferase [Subtercola boreus]|uniref:Mannosyltransferase n=1 Tax=Subtercola boreus TaxID=120213 RepID=A0A3E0VMH4_9MICO|nr:glycosyltransferase [Subtercola boreus]RFA10097.1 mannosyltransferase [Subtercola boreus]TQL52750.1 undecaprenyl-phosphate 4-deoxy-4-formamido-L-arabinose transferase [Subtercola boreus]